MSTARYRFRIQYTDTMATFIIIPFKSIERFYGKSIPNIVTVLECMDDTDYVIETCHYPVFQLPIGAGSGAMLVAETVSTALTELRECLSSVALGLGDDTIRDLNSVVTDAMLIVMIQRHMPMPYVRELNLHNEDHFTPPQEALPMENHVCVVENNVQVVEKKQIHNTLTTEYRFTFKDSPDLLTFVIIPFRQIVWYVGDHIQGVNHLSLPGVAEKRIVTLAYPLFQMERLPNGHFLHATSVQEAEQEMRARLQTCRVGYTGTHIEDCNCMVTKIMITDLITKTPLGTHLPEVEPIRSIERPYLNKPTTLARIPSVVLMADESSFWIDGFMRFYWTHFEGMEAHLYDLIVDQYGEYSGHRLWEAITDYRNTMLISKSV